MNSEHKNCHCCCIFPIPGEAPQDPMAMRVKRTGWEQEFSKLQIHFWRCWVLTGGFVASLRTNINTFLCPFRRSECSRSENVALQKGCDSALWLIYSSHLVKRRNRGTGVESQAEQGQQNNILRASCPNLPADISKSTSVLHQQQLSLIQWKLQVSTWYFETAMVQSVPWNSHGMFSFLCYFHLLFIPLLILMDFNYSILFLNLQSFVHKEHRLLDHWNNFFLSSDFLNIIFHTGLLF